jgi:hypothetical protein
MLNLLSHPKVSFQARAQTCTFGQKRRGVWSRSMTVQRLIAALQLEPVDPPPQAASHSSGNPTVEQHSSFNAT